MIGATISPQFFGEEVPYPLDVDVCPLDFREHRHVVRAFCHHHHPVTRLHSELWIITHHRFSTFRLSGSFGLFFTLFILFMKFLPAIAIAEIKGVMPQADPHWEGYHQHDTDSEASHG